jgi:hypothetical protein
MNEYIIGEKLCCGSYLTYFIIKHPVEATLLQAVVKGMVDVDIRGELITEVEQMDLETTIKFVEIKEMDKKDAASVGLPFPVPEVNLWRQPEEVV